MNAGDWISIVAVIVSVIAFVTEFWSNRITRDHLLLERVHRLSDRLYEFDRILIEFPAPQRLFEVEHHKE